MVTLSSADNALKSFYLDAITDSLNMKVNPFLAKIGRTSDYVTGKEVRKTIRVGINGGIGAGTETGDLPTARGNTYQQLTATLKNLYGTIEISDKAIRASANNEGAFVNLINDEMQSLVKSASYNFGRMLFGDGTGVLGSIDDATANWVIVSNVQNFAVGMYVDVVEGSEKYQNCRVTDVDYKTSHICLDVDKLDDSIIGLSIVLHGSENNEITGLEALFCSENIYGVDKGQSFMKPYVDNDFQEFTEDKLQAAIDTIEAKSGCNVDFIICSWDVRRIIKDYYQQHNISVKTMKIDGGFTAIDFMGIPVVVDRFCPAGTMYLLSSECFKLYQLCDWQWLEAEDGKILKQVPGKPVYTATLVKYAELLCDNIAGQGKLTSITQY